MLAERRSHRLRPAAIVAFVAVAVSAAALFALRLSAQAPPASLSRGRAVYDHHCVECHGKEGRGDGPAAFQLIPKPRDFTTARYKIRTTATGTLPTDEDLLRSVRQGLYGTAMPAWQQILPDDDIVAVVEVVKSFSPRFASESRAPMIASAMPAVTEQIVDRGAAVYETLQCGKCHGSDGRGAGATAHDFQDDWNQPLTAADLTEPWTFHGGSTTADLFMRFRTGMSGTPMPSFSESASDADLWDLAAYVGSLARKPLWDMTADEVTEHFAEETARARANPLARGEALVNALACTLCHSPVDEERRMLPGLKLAGGLRIRLEPFGEYPAGNLTSDKDTGLGAWSDDEIKQAITKGILKDGSRLLPYPMDWASYSTLSDDDLNAIVAYLRTVPAVRNKIPAPRQTFLPLYLWGKFRMLFLGGDPPMTFYAGNAGNAVPR
jgi:mono/diheme cytochrome c family protein